MDASIQGSTVGEFRRAVASEHPMPAGVAASAVSASFALGLVAKVLDVSGRRKDFAGDRATLGTLLQAARDQSQRMLGVADDDIAAFNAYLAAVRLPRGTEHEQAERRRATASAAHQAVEVPAVAARAAASGIDLCARAAGLTHARVVVDLAAAVALLASALRVFLLCADANLRHLPVAAATRYETPAQRQEWEMQALHQADAILQKITDGIGASHVVVDQRETKSVRAGEAG